MRVALLTVPLFVLASPAVAQTAAPPPESVRLPPELTDMRWADRMSDTLVAVSKVFLNLPVGDIQAAVEGREPTASDKRKTIRSETGMSERDVREQIDAARPAMQAGMKAVANALPAMMKGLSEAQREMERATANRPRPDYPKR